MKTAGIVLTVLLLVFASGAKAVDTPLPDPNLEQRARALMSEVRCVVCQSQSIAESDSEIAADMRRLIRDRVAAGDSDAQILDYLVSRYGDFVRFRPPFKASTWPLWIGPFVLLVAALAAGYAFFRRRAQAGPVEDLSESERARVNELIRRGLNPRDGEGA